jgi:hypothetical protein
MDGHDVVEDTDVIPLYENESGTIQECQLLDLPDDCLGVVLSHVRPQYRLRAMLTCKRMARVALTRGFPPWENGARGLLHAIGTNNMSYFLHWKRVAGTRWTNVLIRYLDCLLERCLARGRYKMMIILLKEGHPPSQDCLAQIFCDGSSSQVVEFVFSLKPYIDPLVLHEMIRRFCRVTSYGGILGQLELRDGVLQPKTPDFNYVIERMERIFQSWASLPEPVDWASGLEPKEAALIGRSFTIESRQARAVKLKKKTTILSKKEQRKQRHQLAEKDMSAWDYQ